MSLTSSPMLTKKWRLKTRYDDGVRRLSNWQALLMRGPAMRGGLGCGATWADTCTWADRILGFCWQESARIDEVAPIDRAAHFYLKRGRYFLLVSFLFLSKPPPLETVSKPERKWEKRDALSIILTIGANLCMHRSDKLVMISFVWWNEEVM